MKDSYFLAFEQVSCRLLSLFEVPVRTNWVGREISREVDGDGSCRAPSGNLLTS
jgi:hypothetical protein